MNEESRVLSLPSEAPHTGDSYGPHPDQVIDFWFPEDPATDPATVNAPLVTLVHGGFWRERYDRHHLSPLAAYLARVGYPVALLEYRRVSAGPSRDTVRRAAGPDGSAASPGPSPGLPESCRDVREAVAAAADLVAGLRPDIGLRRQLLVGHSAGGHLALWAAAQPPPNGAAAGPTISGVIALAPVADLSRAIELDTGRGAVRDFLRGDLSLLPQTDPVVLLPTGVPTALLHGRDDDTVPIELSERFVAAARAAGDDTRLIPLGDTGHYSLIEPASPACAVLERCLAAGMAAGAAPAAGATQMGGTKPDEARSADASSRTEPLGGAGSGHS